MQLSWCCRGREGNDEGDVGSRAFSRVVEVWSGKEEDQVLMFEPLLFAKERDDIISILTGMIAGTERKRNLVVRGLWGLDWAQRKRPLHLVPGPRRALLLEKP